MGYEVTGEATLAIRGENLAAALGALGGDAARASRGDDGLVEEIRRELAAWRFGTCCPAAGALTRSGSGATIIETEFDCKLVDQEEVFRRLAPHLEDGSLVEFHGEDGDTWRLVAEDGAVLVEEPVWPRDLRDPDRLWEIAGRYGLPVDADGASRGLDEVAERVTSARLMAFLDDPSHWGDRPSLKVFYAHVERGRIAVCDNTGGQAFCEDFLTARAAEAYARGASAEEAHELDGPRHRKSPDAPEMVARTVPTTADLRSSLSGRAAPGTGETRTRGQRR